MKFCRGCATMRTSKNFREDGRTKDGRSSLCTKCLDGGREFGDIPLEVVDVMGVEIMAAGELVRGTGSPTSGERYAEDALQELADNTNAVVNVVRPFVKIGHSKEQRLAKASGMYDDAENPATGWLQQFRVEGDKLKTDLYAVPKKLARLIESGAFRLRSAELKSYDGKPVIGALSLLGAKAPAFKTLDDIYALYHGEDDERTPTAQLLRDDEPLDDDELLAAYAAGDVVWDPERGAADVMEDISRSLNPNPGNELPSYRYWCCDVQMADGGGSALVRDNQAQDSSVAWVVPFTFDAANEPVPAASSEWTLAQQAWIERADANATSYAENLVATVTETGEPPDTRERVMDPKQKTKTDDELQAALDEQRKQFAEALGLPETATDDEVTAELAKRKTPPTPKAPGSDDGTRTLTEAEYQEIVGQAKQGAQAYEEARVERRDALVDGAIKDAKIAPSDRDRWIKRYDEAPDITKEILADLKPDPNAVRVYGQDGQPEEHERVFASNEDEERAYADYCAFNGIPYIGPTQRTQTQQQNPDDRAVTP